MFASSVLWAVAGCDRQPEGPTEADLAAWRSEIDLAEDTAHARQAGWHRAVGEALAKASPPLGGPCEQHASYPHADFGDNPWTSTHHRVWDDQVRSARVTWAEKQITGARKYLAETPPNVSMVESYLGDMKRIAAADTWTADVTEIDVEQVVPEQTSDGTYIPGSLTVRALLYSYAEDRVVCEGTFKVSNGSEIVTSVRITATEAEIRRAKAASASRVPDAALMGELVALDLMKKAHDAAGWQLKQVVP